jgi:hypothetical protein
VLGLFLGAVSRVAFEELEGITASTPRQFSLEESMLRAPLELDLSQI